MEILIQKVPTETGVLRKRILEEGVKEIQDFLLMEKEQHRSCFHFSFLLLKKFYLFWKNNYRNSFYQTAKELSGAFLPPAP